MEDEGPDAALELQEAYERELLEAFTPALGVATNRQLLDRYFPDEDWREAGELAGREAKEAALLELLAVGDLVITPEIESDVSAILDDLAHFEGYQLLVELLPVLDEYDITIQQLEDAGLKLPVQLTDGDGNEVLSLDDLIRPSGTSTVTRFRYGGIDWSGDHTTPRIVHHPTLFGERETGGEAFIPLGGGAHQRDRSRALLARVGDLLDMNVQPRDVTPIGVPVPQVAAAASRNGPDVGQIVERTVRSVLAAQRQDRQSQYDGAVIVERIEQLTVGAGESSRQTARDTITEMQMEALGI